MTDDRAFGITVRTVEDGGRDGPAFPLPPVCRCPPPVGRAVNAIRVGRSHPCGLPP
ncbi:hypothetical protein HMPREF9141_2084 [Prevotella multiformis DSM 16608]|uniref:Uncharacterized protein n=1 Tax=Prevotella multiformis DSM 16608 TaxID=888743 RepID=F0F917_9BACT|nr:hypothetical protein HMPREF9141_2084 [Prevotella multiformis DSM 16608]